MISLSQLPAIPTLPDYGSAREFLFEMFSKLSARAVQDDYQVIVSAPLTRLGIDVTGTPVTTAAPGTVVLQGASLTIGISDFGGSGTGHARGAVPDPGATPGTTRFLREDGGFAAPPSTYVPPVTTKGDLFGFSTVPDRLPVSTDGKVLTADAASALGVKWATPAAGGVTSIGVSAPSDLLVVSGSPVTTSGTIALAKATVAKNKVYAGPVSGADANPTFRVVDFLDVPVNAGRRYWAAVQSRGSSAMNSGVSPRLLTIETPTGTINDSNTSFTNPTDLTGLAAFVVVDGVVDWAALIAGTAVTTSSTPHSSVRVVSSTPGGGSGTVAQSADQRTGYGKGCANEEKNTSVAASTTQTLVDVAGMGVFTGLFLNSSGSDTHIVDEALVNVYVDGEVSPSISFTIDDGFFHFYANTGGFMHPRIGLVEPSGAGSSGGYLYLPYPAPFRSHLKVDYVNPSAINAAAIYSTVYFNLGGTYNPKGTRFAKLHAVAFNASVAAYAESTLFDAAGKGSFVGLHFNLISGSANWNPLEGFFRFYTDSEGTASFKTSGTEDYFGNGNYFAFGRVGSDYMGTAMLDAANHRVGAYRYHLLDPLNFETHGTLTWQNGVSGISRNVTTNTAIRGIAWYTLDE